MDILDVFLRFSENESSEQIWWMIILAACHMFPRSHLLIFYGRASSQPLR